VYSMAKVTHVFNLLQHGNILPNVRSFNSCVWYQEIFSKGTPKEWKKKDYTKVNKIKKKETT
jgi:hypothetical protein